MLIIQWSMSDVLGKFIPLVSKDWTQSEVARLFYAIKVCIFFFYLYRSNICSFQLEWDCDGKNLVRFV